MHIYAGTHKNKKLIAPKGQLTRPTTGRLRETLFNICQAAIEEAHFLDLFAGSGAMGIEALSRGAKDAIFIDNSKESLRCVEQNLRQLGLEKQAQVLFGDVFSWLAKLAKQPRKFNLIYADPPYDLWTYSKGDRLSFSTRLLKLIDEHDLLLPSGMLFIEDSSSSQPDPIPLQNLQLKSSRSIGRSVLQQYLKI